MSKLPDNVDASLSAWKQHENLLTPQRREKMLAVAAQRTRKICLVLQDIHHPHNVSACLRSAEAFGVLDIKIVNLREKFKASTVGRGVHHWLNIDVFSNIEDCAASLRQSGYQLATGLPDQSAVSLDKLPCQSPLALIFGNEHAGVDPKWKEVVDHRFTIPMVGFVESLNISVSCAVSLYHATQASRAHWGKDYFLSGKEQSLLLDNWIKTQYDWIK